MCSEKPELTFKQWLYKCVRKHDQPEVNKTRTFTESTLEIKMNVVRKM